MNAPLTGITVVDLSTTMAGPFATMQLAEQGARVIKIEAPGGDVLRGVGSGRGGMSGYFANLNRGKQSMVIDLRTEAGVDVVRRLVKTADVFVQAYRPGVAESMGLGPQHLRDGHPQLVYASISGFGSAGPLADQPAYDHVLQALSGMAALQTGADGQPSLIRHGVVDKTTGMSLTQAILGALLRREREGVGAEVEVTMLDAALHFLWPDGMMNDTLLGEVNMQPPVSRGFRLTNTADGHVALITLTDKQWEGLIDAMDLPGLLDGIDVSGASARMRNGGQVMRRVGAELATWPTDKVVSHLRAHGVPCMPVVPLSDVARHEQVVAAGSLVEREHPVLGPIRYPRPTPRTAGEEPLDLISAPTLGADTRAILAELEYDDARIDALHVERIVA